jgi:hypothetical protein
MTEEEFKEAKSAYHTFLKGNVARVKFKKVNGDIRDMLCTLREDLLPAAVEGTTVKRQNDTNDEVVAVYDIESEGWRSFRIDNVIEMNLAPEYLDA